MFRTTTAVVGSLLLTLAACSNTPETGPGGPQPLTSSGAASIVPVTPGSVQAPPTDVSSKKRVPGGVAGLTLFVSEEVQIGGSAAKEAATGGPALCDAVKRELLKSGFRVVESAKVPHHLTIRLSMDVETGRPSDFARLKAIDEGRLLISLEGEQTSNEERAFVNGVAKKLVDLLAKSPDLEAFARGPRGELEPPTERGL